MQIHQLQPRTSRKRNRRIGRGGKRGTYSGRGTKGQLARSGHKLRPELRDIIKKIPRLRGTSVRGPQYKSEPLQVVNIGVIEKIFGENTAITPKILLEKGLVRRSHGKDPRVKLLGTGALTKKFTFKGFLVSASVKASVEKAGGKIN